MHRFFIPAELFTSTEIRLPAEISQQISRVLRLRSGDAILLLDNQGFEYPAVLQEVQGNDCRVRLQDKNAAEGEPQSKIILILGLTQREKFELILQKCTEVGVTTFQPVITSRSMVQKTGDAEEKYPRWRKIVQEAAEQSRRGRIPTILPVLKLEEALKQSHAALKLVLWEDETRTSLKSGLRDHTGDTLSLLVGPEGGLSAAEVDLARQHGFQPVSLGRRILRMETAAILAPGLVLYELEG